METVRVDTKSLAWFARVTLADLRLHLDSLEQEAHEALQFGGYVPLDDDADAGVTLGQLRYWIETLEEGGAETRFLEEGTAREV